MVHSPLVCSNDNCVSSFPRVDLPSFAKIACILFHIILIQICLVQICILNFTVFLKSSISWGEIHGNPQISLVFSWISLRYIDKSPIFNFFAIFVWFYIPFFFRDSDLNVVSLPVCCLFLFLFFWFRSQRITEILYLYQISD